MKRCNVAGEGSLQAYMKKQCKNHGILWRKIRFEGVNGAPDTIIAFGGKVMLLELKNPNGNGVVAEQQRRRIQEFTNVGIIARIISTRGMVNAAIAEIKGE